MVSQYGILTVEGLNNKIRIDITQTTVDGTRIFSDTFIESIITRAEQRVFSDIHTTYTLAELTASHYDIYDAIVSYAKMLMENELKTYGLIPRGELIDEPSFYAGLIAPLTEDKQAETRFAKVYSASNYRRY